MTPAGGSLPACPGALAMTTLAVFMASQGLTQRRLEQAAFHVSGVFGLRKVVTCTAGFCDNPCLQ